MKDDLARGLGFFVAGLGPLAVALVLVPFRDQAATTAVVSALLVSVIAAAAVLAGVPAAATATLVAVLSYNFFFTRPYLVLEVDSSDDVWPMVVLLATGVGAAVIVGRRRPSRGMAPPGPPPSQPNQSRHIERVVGLINQDADPRDLISAVQAELTALLVLRGCRFDADASASRLPRLERNGMVSGSPDLPAAVELPLDAGGRPLGRFVLHPTPGASVPLEHRIVAVILTDHLAAAIVSHQPTAPH